MRWHIGSHILKDNLENVCGFCGVQGCDIDISCGSGRGKTVSEVPQSRCDFYEKLQQTDRKGAHVRTDQSTALFARESSVFTTCHFTTNLITQTVLVTLG